MRDRGTWQDACGALGGLRQRKDTLLSNKMRDRETWQDAGSALWGPRQRKDTLLSKMRDREMWQDADSFFGTWKTLDKKQKKKRWSSKKGNEG